mgnify:CR=1 FL=1
MEEYDFNNYCQMINNSPEDNLEITDNNNNIIGFAIKRNANICTFKVYFKKFLA